MLNESQILASLGFGCAKLFRTSTSRSRQRLLETAFDCGIRHFDVARMYGLGAAEAELGKFLRGKRDDVSVATKFGIPLGQSSSLRFLAQTLGRKLTAISPRVRNLVVRRSKSLYAPKNFSVDEASHSLQQSLKELQIDCVDVFFLHEPTERDDIPSELWDWMQDQQSRGSIRSFGVSGDPREMIATNVSNWPWPVVQFSHNLFSEFDIDRHVSLPSSVITFSAISDVLVRVRRLLAEDQRIGRALAERFGREPTDEAELPAILLRCNLAAYPGSKVLFSTSKPERLQAIVARTATLPWEQETHAWLRDCLCSGADRQ